MYLTFDLNTTILKVNLSFFNRYILICRTPLYSIIFSWQKSILICVGLWIWSFLLDIPNFVDWGGHTYDMKTMACSYDRLASYSYTLFFIAMFVVFPLVTVLFSNVNIFLTVMASKKRVAASGGAGTYGAKKPTGKDGVSAIYAVADDGQSVGGATEMTLDGTDCTIDEKPLEAIPEAERTEAQAKADAKAKAKTEKKRAKERKAKGKEMRSELRLARTLFIVFIVFCVCWTPYALVCLIDRYDKAPKWYYAFSILLAHASSTLNSLLYAVTNKGFRDAYKVFLKRVCPCCEFMKEW